MIEVGEEQRREIGSSKEKNNKTESRGGRRREWQVK